MREESGIRDEGHGGFGRHRGSAAMGAETAKEGTIQWLYTETDLRKKEEEALVMRK